MKKLIAIFLLCSCVTAPNYTFNDEVIELTGYVANGNEPVVFDTDSTLHFVYEYTERDRYLDRTVRTILVREESGRYVFVASSGE